MGGGGLGKIFDTVVRVGTLGMSDMLGLTSGGIKDPSAPEPASMSNQLGNVVGGGEGKTFDISEQDKQRGSVSKKRLGAKQLQIPLANASAGGINTSAATGVNT